MNAKFHKDCENTGKILKISCVRSHFVKFDIYFLLEKTREKEKDVKHSISMLFLQLTQVLMSFIVVVVWSRGENETCL